MIFASKLGINIGLETINHPSESGVLIVCLHGFTGCKEEWSFPFNNLESKYSYLLIDLPGFGDSDKPEDIRYYSPEFFDSLLNELLTKFGLSKNILLGYSMGGRYCLNYALQFQGFLSGLILESTSAGIEDNYQREQRVRTDEQLSMKVKAEGLESFLEFWSSQELFKSQKSLPEELQNWLHENKTRTSADSIVNSLSAFGQGVMPFMGNHIKSIKLPTLAITGGLDAKYCSQMKSICEAIPQAEHHIIENSGHNTHIEKPQEFAKLVNVFIKNFIEN